MTTSGRSWGWQIGLASWLAMGGAIATSGDCAHAQIAPDTTLGAENSVVTPTNIDGLPTERIDGGAVRGTNLFHSFEQFSVPPGSAAYFNNALDVQNIFSRVTGGEVSNIDGLIRANGTANLFLLNPNGIIFGPNASLNIGGSFLASTASAINFADGTQFSATAHPTTPLLTVSVPIGLQYGGTAGSILNQSQQATNSSYKVVGLQVQPGRTLALVGGDVKLDRGRLTAPGGRVELGGLAGAGMVEFQGNGSNLSLSFPEEVVRADVTITNEGAPEFTNIYTSAGVDVVGSDGGSIAINARNIDITGDVSVLSAGINGHLALPNAKAGDITLNATEMITISQNSRIFNNQGGAYGSPGNISMQAKGSIFVADSFIYNILFGGVDTPNRIIPSGNKENSGNVSIQADGSVSIKNSGILNLIYFGDGNTGNVSVQANESVSLADSSISTTTYGQGNSGDITVQTDALRILSGSGLQATSRGEGDGGKITVNVNTLEIARGGQILTSAFSNGHAGSIMVNATDSITLSGSDPDLLDKFDDLNTVGLVSPASGLFANTTEDSTGQGGNLRIETGRLNVRDGAEVNVNSAGAGAAGDLAISADSIRLDNQGSIQATTVAGNQGNITLRSQDLVLRRGSNITTNATGTASGGNITIDTGVIAASENSDISANAQNASGGRIIIDAQGIFGTEFRDALTPESDITATGGSPELSGTVEINTPDVDPTQGLATLPAELVDVSGLIAQGCPGSRGNVGRGVSEFIITGRGGLPPSPREALRSDAVQVDLGTPIQGQENRALAAPSTNPTSSPPPTQIVEAQGWVINNYGEVVLTATAPTVTPHIPWLTQASCHTPEASS